MADYSAAYDWIEAHPESLTPSYGLGHTEIMPDTDTITETDLAEAQFPHHEVEEMEAEDFGRACCQCIPCLDPERCPR